MGYTQGVAARVLVLSDRPLERFVEYPEADPRGCREPDKRRETDAAALQIVDQLLEVDRAAGVLGSDGP
jgi:hypothetical protein